MQSRNSLSPEDGYKFFLAVNKNDFLTFTKFIEAGIDKNLQAEDGATALILASERGNLEIVKFLLKKSDVKLDQKRFDGATALILASQNGHAKVVEALLAKDPNLASEQTKEGLTSLHLASQQGHLEVVKILVEKDPNLTSKKTQKGDTPLHLASQRGHSEIIKIILEKNPDVIKIQKKDGTTPLHLASQRGHLEVVKILLEKNPDLINQKIANDLTALDLALRRNQSKVDLTDLERRNIPKIIKFLEKEERKSSTQARVGHSASDATNEKVLEKKFSALRKKFSALRIDRQDSPNSLKSETGDGQNSSKSENCRDYWQLCKDDQWKELEALIRGDGDILFNHKHSEASMAMGGSTEKTLFHRMVESGAPEALAILKNFSQPLQFNLKCNIGYKIGDGQSEGDEIRGITPLYLAVDKQKKEMVQYLIERSNVDEIVTKNAKDKDGSVNFSILEMALKRSGSAEGFEILKIMTGDNVDREKARFFKYNEGDERRGVEMEKMARNFQKYGAEVKNLLEQRYPDEIKIIKEEIKTKSKQPEAKVSSPSLSGESRASSSFQSSLNLR